MKRITWFVTVAALLVGCSGLAAAQCAGNLNPGGYDLLSTFSGTQDNLSSIGLGVVTFSGVALPGGTAGGADTVVCRITPLPASIPPGGSTLNIQIVALYLQGSSTYHGQNVTVYATINQTNGAIPATQLPQPDALSIASTGTMTVFSSGTFNTNLLNIQADLIVVPQGGKVTDTPIFTTPMPADTMSSSGSTWTTTAPAGYPNSTTFPSGGFYVNESGGGGLAATLITSRVVRGSLYGLGLLLVGIAVMKIRSSVKGGRLTLRPVYLLGLAAMAWFVAWRAGKVVFPTIAHAAGITTCVPHTTSAWVNEGGGHFVVHKIVTAVCTTTQVHSFNTGVVSDQ
ncbi:MAG TPA: hypothetical protein VI636_16425 [Candidatus Angelobacter sp.]